MVRAKHPEERTGHGSGAPKLPVRNEAWETPEMPASLSDSQRWRKIWSLGGPSGAYNPVADFGLVSRYCSYSERRENLLVRLDSEGWTAEGASGQLTVHPCAKLLADVEAKLVGVEDRLGLSPQARNTISIGAAQAKSVIESWLGDE
mgnify:CR=1 FL=1|jgi:P27 family predicted phage terminase small subunit